jgi:hypothetical protein
LVHLFHQKNGGVEKGFKSTARRLGEVKRGFEGFREILGGLKTGEEVLWI